LTIKEKEMTAQELLKPRYKLINEYPGCPFIDGNIYEPEFIFSEDYSLKTVEDIEKYPNIFKRTDWVEGREGRDWFPEYIKRQYEGRTLFYRLIDTEQGKRYRLLPNLEIGLLTYMGYALPSSKEEYEQFTSKAITAP
jgi:hypothetical protein